VGRIGSEVRASASFQQTFPPGSYLRHQKGVYDLEGVCPGRGWPPTCTNNDVSLRVIIGLRRCDIRRSIDPSIHPCVY